MNTTMDLTPPSRRSEPRSRTKSGSRLLRSSDEFDENHSHNTTIKPPSPLHLSSPQNPLPLQELLLLSPSPLRRSKTRLLERIDMDDELVEPIGSRRKCRSRGHSSSLMGCASPKNGRRARRRLDHESREERDLGVGDENGKVRRKRSSRQVASRKEKLSSSSSIPSLSLLPKSENENWIGLDKVRKTISELIMWTDIAKSSLWFGIGSLCFLSSCFTTGVSFSIVSAISQLGLLFLAMAFFYNSFSHRHKDEKINEFILKEEDLIHAARLMLPAVNTAIVIIRELFSGEPSMTLKIAPIFLLASEYGHLITLWRFLATGFFVSFTVPKLYSCYSCQIEKRVERLRSCVWDAWEACSHKKVVAASVATAFWNLSSVRTRIFTAFLFVVVVRYYRQQSVAAEEGGEEVKEQQLAIVLAEEPPEPPPGKE